MKSLVLILGSLLLVAAVAETSATVSELTKSKVADLFVPHASVWPLPANVALGDEKLKVHYTLEPELQKQMERLVLSYRPDYTAFVAMEADTGRILSLFSYSKQDGRENLVLRASFPAASLIKIVTATAALDSQRMTPDSKLAFTGSNHTLYRRNVYSQSPNRWAREVTLSDAFAKSMNTFFAKIGLFVIEPKQLIEYAGRFYFNQPIPLEIPVQISQFGLALEDTWSVAEVASGFNRNVTLSPLHAAMLAASVANEGVMMEPCLVDSLEMENGESRYHCTPKVLATTMSAQSAEGIRQMMAATISHGTARQSFRPLFRRADISYIEVGGKTGSLVGLSPKGKYDWFVGYARGGEKKVAVAALTINEDYWKVKASHLARMFIEGYFSKARDVAIGNHLGLE